MPNQRDNIRRGNSTEENEHNWYGFYRGKVIDSHDLKKLGRVKMWIPDLMPEGAAEEMDPCLKGLWAHPANNAMGGRNLPDMMGDICEFDEGWYQGSCLIPPEGSWMWIFFENGDPNWPYYFAAADTGARKVLPENQQGPDWEKKWTIIKTRMGRVILCSDDTDDERVEITGKKRLITNEPDGDDDSVFTIDENQTTILMDERAGHEKLLIRDYRGNYINLRTNDEGVQDQLHIYMKDDIHIETLKNLYIKTGEDMHIENGAKYKLHAKDTIDVKGDMGMQETALMINRLAYTTDNRTAGVIITDTAGVISTRNAGVAISDNATTQCARSTLGAIADNAAISINQTAGLAVQVFAGAGLQLSGAVSINLKSEGPVNIDGAMTNEQCGSIPAIVSPWIFLPLIALPASSATPANPYGERSQEPNNSVVANPPDPEITDAPQITVVSAIPDGDPYDQIERPPTSYSSDALAAMTLPSIFPSDPNVTVVETPVETVPVTGGGGGGGGGDRIVGVGHMFAISLQDEYRDKIIPSAKASGATHTGFYLLRDLDPGADNQYLDPVEPWNNYRRPGLECSSSSSLITCSEDMVPDWEDWNPLWWERFEDFCRQANQERIGIVPTLFDFCCSPFDPFIQYISNPYTTVSWKDSAQGKYVRKVVQVLEGSGADYILNFGCKSYNMNQENNTKLLPDSGYIGKLLKLLVEGLEIPSKNLALTANSNRNLFAMNPLTRYQMYTGTKRPGENQVNNEEYVDGHWGGTGRVYVYDEDGNLVDGYVKYLQDSVSGLPCMNNWKMNYFDDGSHDINMMFAPRQREAMRIVLGIEGNGNI